MSRVRDRSVIKSSLNRVIHYHLDGTVYDFPPNVSTVVDADIMVDEPTPGFARASAAGKIFIKPMSKHKGSVSFASVNRTITDTRGFRVVHLGDYDMGQGSWSYAHIPGMVEAIEKASAGAITSAYANVGSPDVALLTELAELKETIAFLYSPVKGMVNLTQRFRRHLKRVERINERAANKLAKWEKLPSHIKKKREKPVKPELPVFRVGRFQGTDISSSWLAYRYGLMPLIYTFQDVEALLKKRIEGPQPRATARGKESFEKDVQLSSSFIHPEGDSNFSVGNTTTGKAKVTCRAGVLYTPDFSLQAQLGLQWNRVPMALYEAIPLSFVTDWFHNGANAYDALTAEFRALEILGAWVVTTVDYECEFAQTMVPITLGASVSNGSTSGTTRGQWKIRKLASLSDVRVQTRVNLNSKRVADGLALIHSFLATALKKR